MSEVAVWVREVFDSLDFDQNKQIHKKTIFNIIDLLSL